MFRKQIRMLLNRIKKFKYGEFEVNTESDRIEAVKKEIEDQPEKKSELIKSTLHDLNLELTKGTEKNAGDRTLLVFTANLSHKENLKYNIYYDPATRHHNSPFKYIGLYKDSEVFAIGEVKKIISCNYIDEKLIGTNGSDINSLSAAEYERIKEIIENTEYYDLETGTKFFLVDDFYPTHYKTHGYPIRQKKYFWLDEVEGFKEGMTAAEVAQLLNDKEW